MRRLRVTAKPASFRVFATWSGRGESDPSGSPSVGCSAISRYRTVAPSSYSPAPRKPGSRRSGPTACAKAAFPAARLCLNKNVFTPRFALSSGPQSFDQIGAHNPERQIVKVVRLEVFDHLPRRGRADPVIVVQDIGPRCNWVRQLPRATKVTAWPAAASRAAKRLGKTPAPMTAMRISRPTPAHDAPRAIENAGAHFGSVDWPTVAVSHWALSRDRDCRGVNATTAPAVADRAACPRWPLR